jgi:hypothetical protein
VLHDERANFIALILELAALSFSFARVVESENLRNRVMFAGERLLHGGILVLVASLMKYVMLGLVLLPLVADTPLVHGAIHLTIGMLACLIFSNGVLFAHTGLRVLNDILLLRMTREKDWDDPW